ncbi:DEAD/DEAH box helicase family protein [Lacticaseibacillus paracasei]|nr:DEAD/DEAH box helicase [Lacticaseibacillus paracasei]MCZ2766920.1 DEAD/DEAH box helicase family protein [Lacticaseibacillus paracasei]MCZ2769838.1 DEAD/DEAH box helicase family protein [Lacticaseibacillus paracasei]MCZ2775357.1 DEAD/DEAH box helicase family protein [Lacticaseibacillus paracasei]MCZ2778274.1 DEAD/DEAH box helicase family protein [Lacticaseibacillus paracasei]MCZ2784514.1 DEAD/DEAH box helicase family protein [Lacticaseibacillus paracasei]
MQSRFSKHLDRRDVAIELPTGSGKTLVGLIIGEYRRRKRGEQVVFVCTNNILVDQVCTQAIKKYGIRVLKFTGTQSEYSTSDMHVFLRNEAIAVTNYSSVFNNNSFFSDVDTFIFDDIHGADNYIASPWTFTINRFLDGEGSNEQVNVVYDQIMDLLSTTESSPEIKKSLVDDPEVENSVNSVSLFELQKFWNAISEIVESNRDLIKDSKYAWSNIKEHLGACNLFYDKKSITIKPLYSPTLTLENIRQTKQRIYLSATFGHTEQTSRTIGVSDKIDYIKLDSNREPTGGRHYLLFPIINNQNENQIEKYANLLTEVIPIKTKAVILTKNNRDRDLFNALLPNSFKKFDISRIQDFYNSEDGIIVLSNRYDGLDFEEDLSHLLVLSDIALATNLQERFLSSRINARILYIEQIQTRIIQAIGRASRSEQDYSVVIILGTDLQNQLQSHNKVSPFPKMIQAEINTGIQLSSNIENSDNPSVNLSKVIESLTSRNKTAIEKVEKQINEELSLLNDDKNQPDYLEKLNRSAKYELKCNYDLWNNNYDEAFVNAEKAVHELSDDIKLLGYRAFWLYLAAYSAYEIFQKTQDPIDKKKCIRCIAEMHSASQYTPWFGKVIVPEFSESTNANESNFLDDSLSLLFENIETSLFSGNLKKTKLKYRKDVTKTLEKLKVEPDSKSNGKNGKIFEQGFQELGRLLGYRSENTVQDSAPDPWWFIDDTKVVVSECKIITEHIPTKYVRQAAGHKEWLMKNNIPGIGKDTSIITVFISNQTKLKSDARTFADNIYYLNQDALYKFAVSATNTMAELITELSERNDISWRDYAKRKMVEKNVTPSDLLKLIEKEKLSELPS